MVKLTVGIPSKDRNIGAMVKALAVEVAGFQATKGNTKERLATTGQYRFECPNEDSAGEFRDALQEYLPKGSFKFKGK